MVFVTIVRHGETKGNVAKVIQSRTDGELTDRGILMAKSLGNYLQNETFTHIYSSDLKRCRDTTELVVGQLKTKVPPTQHVAMLREKDQGDYEHMAYQTILNIREALGLPIYKAYKVDVPNGEKYEDCKLRMGGFFSEKILPLVDEEEEQRDGVPKNVLVVSHGNAIACLLEYFLERSAQFDIVNFQEEDLKHRKGNTSRTRIAVTKAAATNKNDTEEGASSASAKRFCLNFTHIFDVDHLPPNI